MDHSLRYSFLTFLLFALVFNLSAQSRSAGKGLSATPTPKAKQALFKAVKNSAPKKALLLPAVLKAKEPAKYRKYNAILDDYISLKAKIKRTNGENEQYSIPWISERGRKT